jgi:hypothetical protein
VRVGAPDVPSVSARQGKYHDTPRVERQGRAKESRRVQNDSYRLYHRQTLYLARDAGVGFRRSVEVVSWWIGRFAERIPEAATSPYPCSSSA